MKLEFTYEESDCYEYDPEATYIGGAPPTRTEGIPVGWKKDPLQNKTDLIFHPSMFATADTITNQVTQI